MGSAVHLADAELGHYILEFKMPHILGIIVWLRKQELGYHIFNLNVHLFQSLKDISH